MFILQEVCIFGDSISKGIIYNTERKRYTPLSDCFAALLEKTNNLSIKNYSIFGCTIEKGLSIIHKHFKELDKTDCIALEFGGNDCDYDWQKISDDPSHEHFPNTTVTAFKETYTKIIDDLKTLNKKMVILNLPPLDADKYFNWISKNRNAENIKNWLGGNPQYIYRWHEMYSNLVCEIASASNIKMIDIRSAFLKLRNYSDYLCEDGIHPNAKGHLLISKAVGLAFNN